ncbi:MAG: hypothetical protein EOO75_04295, partial [Myxococcales bacterium]
TYFEHVLARDEARSVESTATSLPPALLSAMVPPPVSVVEGPRSPDPRELRTFESITGDEVTVAVPPLPSRRSTVVPPMGGGRWSTPVDPALGRWAALAEPLPQWAAMLGRRTADLHQVLGSESNRTEFAPVPFDVLHQQSLYQNARTLFSRALELLRQRREQLSEADRAAADWLVGQAPEIDRRLRDVMDGQLAAMRIRCHGDLHLGQVLFTGDDFVFVDFEGEPARKLSERRYKRNVLRDVAGMMRSFAYAAEAALRQRQRRRGDAEALEPWAHAWVQGLSNSFLDAYLERLDGSPLVSEGEVRERLLRFYLLDKCIYEVYYELTNRPDWVGIPLAGLRRLLAGETP